MKRLRRVQRLSRWRYGLLLPVSWLLKLWWKTLRVTISEEDERLLKGIEKPLVVLLWHNRLFVAGYIYHRFNPKGFDLYGLISASKDGAWLAAIMEHLGIKAIRGSSSWRGKEALKEMVKVLNDGNHVAITPDGPRGPCYDVKKGVLFVAEHAQCPVLLLSCNFSSAWRFKSWDKFYIPKPFSRLKIKGKIYPAVEALCPDGDPEAIEVVKQSLMGMTEDV